MFSDLLLPVQQVLTTFNKKIIDTYNPLAIVLVGSYAKGYESPHSDIDVCIVVPDQDWRERGNTWINGYEVEYFINPVKQIFAYLESEDPLRPNTADMYGTGLVLYSRDPVIDQIIATSKQVLLTAQKPFEGVELELARYSIDDTIKDLKDLESTDYAYQQTLWSGIERALQYFFRYQGTFMQRLTIRLNQIAALDKPLAHKLELLSKDPLNKDYGLAVLDHVEALIRPRPQEWTLRGPLTIE